MHGEFSFYSPGLFIVGTAALKRGEELPGGTIPRSIQIYLAEGCAPVFTGLQLIR